MGHANRAVLLLNNSCEPVAFAPLRRALTLVVKNRARVQEDRGYEIYSGIMFPTVIRLTEQVYIPYRRQKVSRRNILLRDKHRCAYCDKHLHPSELTLDHVIPKSKGGPSSYENLVACCSPCNKRKDDKSLEESGMTLLRRPHAATIHTSRFVMRSMAEDEPAWKKYLYFDSSESTHVTRGVEA